MGKYMNTSSLSMSAPKFFYTLIDIINQTVNYALPLLFTVCQ